MWCLQSLLIEWDGTGFDRLEPVAAILFGARATKTYEGWIEWCGSLIGRMIVAAMRVGLPDLHHRIRNRQSIAIKHTPLDTDALSNGLRLRQHIAPCIFTQQCR